MVDAFERANDTANISHHRRTVHWIQKLKPDAGEALLIAGTLHDIERAFHGDWKAGSSDPEKLARHQELSSQEAEIFLRSEKADEWLIAEVKRLIEHHEEGGDEDQNILCNADVLAWLEEKAALKAQINKAQGTEKEFRKKLDYLYGRIKPEHAKAIAHEWRTRWIIGR